MGYLPLSDDRTVVLAVHRIRAVTCESSMLVKRSLRISALWLFPRSLVLLRTPGKYDLPAFAEKIRHGGCILRHHCNMTADDVLLLVEAPRETVHIFACDNPMPCILNETQRFS